MAPTVGLAHLHAPAVSVREQAGIIGDRLRRERVASFRSLVADADSTLVVVARFLALLELFRESAIGFEQAEALGELDGAVDRPRGGRRSRSTTSSTSRRRASDDEPAPATAPEESTDE